MEICAHTPQAVVALYTNGKYVGIIHEPPVGIIHEPPAYFGKYGRFVYNAYGRFVFSPYRHHGTARRCGAVRSEACTITTIVASGSRPSPETPFGTRG